MKGLGLIALMLVLAFAVSQYTGRGPANASGLPAKFVSQESGWPDRAVKKVFNLEPKDNFIAEPWPFTASKIHFACADSALTVVDVGGRYAALNGHTSGLSSRYRVENDRGERGEIIRTNDNQNYKNAGMVKADAENMAIGSWWDALNKRLLRECP